MIASSLPHHYHYIKPAPKYTAVLCCRRIAFASLNVGDLCVHFTLSLQGDAVCP